MKTLNIRIIITALLLTGLSSCKKYLDVKPNDKLAIVATLTDAQLLLDNYAQMNVTYMSIPEMMADDYYLSDADYAALPENIRNTYKWQKDETTGLLDWPQAYATVFNCNTVLDAYDKIMSGKTETADSKNVLGSALFFRSYYFYGLAQYFAPIYDQGTAATDPGIPLRLDGDFMVKSTRATVKETYDRIIADFKKAAVLLPVIPLVKSRPSKPAAYGALAKVYLAMRDYSKAGLYADSCLQLYSELLDFNTLSKTSAAPFARFNKEVIFHARSAQDVSLSINPTRAKVENTLYQSYQNSDLRKAHYFRANTGTGLGTYNFKGNYDGQATISISGFVSAGIMTDEMYLIRAEAYARAGNSTDAMKDLNTLLKTRWEGTYAALTATNAAEALKIVLVERRKELLYRGTRWTDLRRLSKEPEHAVIPKRTIAGEVYELQPGSPRYVTAIPLSVITVTGMPQNP